MKILIINTTDAIGGAANLAWQLGNKIRKEGNQVRYLVGYKYTKSSDVDVISASIFSEFIRNIFGNNVLRYLRHLRAFIFSNDIDFGASHEIINHPWFKGADIVHIHNLHGHYFKLSTLIEVTKRKPVVWTLHDMWSMTSHCGFCFECKHFNHGKHFTSGIYHYQPMLWNNSKYLWTRKHDIYKESNFRIISPSKWLKGVAESTNIFGDKKMGVIQNGVDTKIFHPTDKKLARKSLNLPLDKKIILGIYSGNKHDRKKRFEIFKRVSNSLRNNKDLLFVCLGRTNKEIQDKNILYRPYQKNPENLAKYYSASNLFFMTSAMENASMANLEALACGLTVLAFNNTGSAEINRNHLLEEGSSNQKCINCICNLLNEKASKHNFKYKIDNTVKIYLKYFNMELEQ